jgi:hypothetical protein
LHTVAASDVGETRFNVAFEKKRTNALQMHLIMRALSYRCDGNIDCCRGSSHRLKTSWLFANRKQVGF